MGTQLAFPTSSIIEVPTNTIAGRISSGTGELENLDSDQVKSILGLSDAISGPGSSVANSVAIFSDTSGSNLIGSGVLATTNGDIFLDTTSGDRQIARLSGGAAINFSETHGLRLYDNLGGNSFQLIGNTAKVSQGTGSDSATGGIRNLSFDSFGWWPYGNNKSSIGQYGQRVMHMGLTSNVFYTLVPSDGRLGFQLGTLPSLGGVIGNHFQSITDGIGVFRSDQITGGNFSSGPLSVTGDASITGNTSSVEGFSFNPTESGHLGIEMNLFGTATDVIQINSLGGTSGNLFRLRGNGDTYFSGNIDTGQTDTEVYVGESASSRINISRVSGLKFYDQDGTETLQALDNALRISSASASQLSFNTVTPTRGIHFTAAPGSGEYGATIRIVPETNWAFTGIEMSSSGDSNTISSLKVNPQTGENRWYSSSSYYPTIYSSGNKVLEINTGGDTSLTGGLTVGSNIKLDTTTGTKSIGGSPSNPNISFSSTNGLRFNDENGTQAFQVLSGHLYSPGGLYLTSSGLSSHGYSAIQRYGATTQIWGNSSYAAYRNGAEWIVGNTKAIGFSSGSLTSASVTSAGDAVLKRVEAGSIGSYTDSSGSTLGDFVADTFHGTTQVDSSSPASPIYFARPNFSGYGGIWGNNGGPIWMFNNNAYISMNGHMNLANFYRMGWSSTADASLGTVDLSLARVGAGNLAIYNSSAGTTLGRLSAYGIYSNTGALTLSDGNQGLIIAGNSLYCPLAGYMSLDNFKNASLTGTLDVGGHVTVGETGVASGTKIYGGYGLGNYLNLNQSLGEISNGASAWPFKIKTAFSGLRIQSQSDAADLIPEGSDVLSFYTPTSANGGQNSTAPTGTLMTLKAAEIQSGLNQNDYLEFIASGFVKLSAQTRLTVQAGASANHNWYWDAAGLYPAQWDNNMDFGSSSYRVRTGYFGTSIEVPSVDSQSSLTLRSWESVGESWQTGVEVEADSGGVKLGLFGETPVAQPAAVTAASETHSISNNTETEEALDALGAIINDLRDKLAAVGITA